MLILMMSGVFTSAQAVVMPLKMLDMHPVSQSFHTQHMKMTPMDSAANMAMHSDSDCCDTVPPPCCQSDDGCSAEPCYCAAVATLAISSMPIFIDTPPHSLALFDNSVGHISLPPTSVYRPPII